jgi:hypothetical protein
MSVGCGIIKLMKGNQMTMDDLMAQILEILPNAIFEEEMTTGEVVIATGLVDKGTELQSLPEQD